jgi:PEP-CTERM motif
LTHGHQAGFRDRPGVVDYSGFKESNSMWRTAYLLFCLLPLSFAARANTILYSFSYISDDLQHQATAELVATDNGNGTFTAISGSGYYDTFAITLIPNPIAPGAAYSPTGYFYYDDLIIPNQNPVVTNPGLLFSINDSGSTELNIFSEGSVYIAYLNNGSNGNGSFAGTETPEPATAPLTLIGLVGAGLFILRRPTRSCGSLPIPPESSRKQTLAAG